MNFPLIDCVVLAAYLIISFVAGICANKILKSSNKSADGYFLAGRSMPGWLTGISNAVTAMNADVAPAYVGVTWRSVCRFAGSTFPVFPLAFCWRDCCFCPLAAVGSFHRPGVFQSALRRELRLLCPQLLFHFQRPAGNYPVDGGGLLGIT